MTQNRKKFRQAVFDRDSHECLVPWCPREADDAHHLIGRELWETGGYVPNNGASVCEQHHKYAERNEIPPQAFYRWAGIEDPALPKQLETTEVNKWGEPFETPPWEEYRDRIKYPSTRHLPFSFERDDDDTAMGTVQAFTDIPLVITVKMDGSNACIVSDAEEPIRGRNGSSPGRMKGVDKFKQLYYENNCLEKIPEHLQVFGEWLWAKHSIHYGCDCNSSCDDVGPELDSYFQVFGVYDQRHNLWLPWPEVQKIAEYLGFNTTPVIELQNDDSATFTNEQNCWDKLYKTALQTVDKGHEGIVVRSKFPFHYSQIENKLGKYVRDGHVTEGEKHWSKRDVKVNRGPEDFNWN